VTVVQLDSASYWGAIPNDWQFVPIKYGFGLIGSGTTPPTGKEEYFQGIIPWVTSSELRENLITSTVQTLSESALEEFSALKLFPKSTVLIAMYGATIGRVAMLDISACVNQAVCAMAKPIGFEPRYVFYALQASRDYLLSLASGGGQPNLNTEKITEHEIPCPSLSQQRSIAQYLNRQTAKIDTLITAKQNLLELLTEKRRALITHVVTRGLNPDAPLRNLEIEFIEKIPEHWEVINLKFLGEVRTGVAKGRDLGNRELEPSCESRFIFNLRGEITHKEGDLAAKTTIEKLGLDHDELIAFRRAAIQGTLGKKNNLPIKDARIRLKRMKSQQGGRLDPFCFVLVQALEKHISRLEIIAKSKKAQK
jgi:restriction endonuclease S subunit